MVFSSVPESSPWRWGGWHSRRFLESVLWGADFTWLLRLLESVLPGTVLSCHCSGQWRISWGMWSPGAWIFVVVMTVQVSVVPILEAFGHGCQEPGNVLSWVTRLGRNWRPFVPWVQDPNNSPWAFHRADSQSRSLVERQNRYSHVTMGTIAGSSHNHGVSRYDRSRDGWPELGFITEVGMYLHYKRV
jgi:hypothetical protein